MTVPPPHADKPNTANGGGHHPPVDAGTERVEMWLARLWRLSSPALAVDADMLTASHLNLLGVEHVERWRMLIRPDQLGCHYLRLGYAYRAWRRRMRLPRLPGQVAGYGEIAGGAPTFNARYLRPFVWLRTAEHSRHQTLPDGDPYTSTWWPAEGVSLIDIAARWPIVWPDDDQAATERFS